MVVIPTSGHAQAEKSSASFLKRQADFTELPGKYEKRRMVWAGRFGQESNRSTEIIVDSQDLGSTPTIFQKALE